MIITKHLTTIILPANYTTTAMAAIPERTDQYAKYSVIKPKMIELRPDGELYVSRAVFNLIPTYQWGGPSGGATGKMRKRIAGAGWDYENRAEWELCWMGYPENKDLDIIRLQLRDMGLAAFSRDPDDDPVIIETWI